MKQSSYITWAKQKHGIEYNLARSGVTGLPLKELVEDPGFVFESGSHEDGWMPLMQKIAGRYGVDPGQVVLTHGASMANHLVCALLLEPGDEVLVEHPVYEPLKILPGFFHAKAVPFDRLPENGYQPDPGRIEAKITSKTRFILLSDLHNPSGALIDRSLLGDLVQLAEKHGIHLVIDEVYLEFLYPQGERTAAGLSPFVITTRSLTKAFGMDDLRMGWIIAEPSVTRRLLRLRDLFSVTTAFPSERLAWLVLDRAGDLLGRALELLEPNMAFVDRFVQEHPDLEWQKPAAGSVGFVRLKKGSVDALANHLETNFKTLVAPGRFFDMPGYFRIGWGMEKERLETGMGYLDKSL